MERNERFEFNPEQAYRLIAVTDKEGRDKGHSKDFYEERLNCVAINFKYDSRPSHDDKYRLNMSFIQTEDGLWCKRSLHTSTVWEVEETENGIKLHTSYSIYVFEKAELKEVTYKDAANLIELYMSLEDDDYFGKGYYYDEDKKVHELKEHVHVGTFQDSVLVDFMPGDSIHGTVCRYFPLWSSVEFYDTFPHQQEYKTPMLIHNTGKHNLPIRFQGYSKVWTIKPGESKTIIPYKPDGADPEETE